MNSEQLVKVIRPLIPQISGLVHIARNLPGTELEVCLTMQDQSHIPKSYFEQIFVAYSKNINQFQSSKPWFEVRDNFFEDSTIRNRVYSNSTSEWIRKIPLTSLSYNVVGRPLNLKFNLKRELQIQNQKLEYRFVRSKKVYEFCIPGFTFTFSIIWQAATPEECLHTNPIYQIEIELNIATLPLEEDDSKVASHLLHHALQLQGIDTPLTLK